MTSGEVAAAFHVERQTVVQWAKAGKLAGVRTPGSHWRFREADVAAILNGGQS
jgi:excisionase family DNA binding protein